MDATARLSFDIGGTFTDFVLEDAATGQQRFWKVLSTHADPAEGVLEGVDRLLDEAGLMPDQVSVVLHATTVATNAILERKGARTALITTRGFRDVLLLGRQKRYDTNDLRLTKPVPLVARRDILELDERVRHDGKVLSAPPSGAIEAIADAIRAGGYEAVAICLLHGYANPAHEIAMGAAIRRAAQGVAICLSSEVSPKLREYERSSTTVANAYVQPVVSRYITRLDSALRGRGIRPELLVMQSNGGLVSPPLACAAPIRIVESGPAAGVLMCRAIGKAEALPDLLTFDMGGTTAKLGAIDGGEPAMLPTFEVDQVRYVKGSGLPLNIAAIEMLEIGAGGGSIARTELGTVMVGPASAGSDPGPICYGRGGERATVTDANAVLGYLNPAFFNGGRLGLDVAAAGRGIAAQIAEPLGIGVAEAAWAIHRMATANMERALRVVSVERGRDPRRYALVGFGGAGPLHAARLARQVGIPMVVIPRGAGVGSALGLLDAAPRLDQVQTRVALLGPGLLALARSIIGPMEQQLRAKAAALGGALRVSHGVTARYVGQGHEIAVTLPPLDGPETAFLTALAACFGAAYRRTYGFNDPDRAVEVIDWSVVVGAEGAGDRPTQLAARGAAGAAGRAASHRRVYFPECGGFVDCPTYGRDALEAAGSITGPAVVEELESTIVLLPGDRAVLSPAGHLRVTIAPQAVSGVAA